MVSTHAPLSINHTLSRGLDAILRELIVGDEARARLGSLLQAALRLEFATIPVYLSAAFSLGTGNEAIRLLITRVAIEEMLHFTIVANTMNAIGIVPDIDAAVPVYPCDLDLLQPSLHLELRSFSTELVEQLFLRIETPRQPIIFEAELVAAPKTVGEFYEGIISIIESGIIPGLFNVDPATRNALVIPDPPAFRPIGYRDDNDVGTYPIPPSIDFAISDSVSAVRHLRWLVDQGEGTSKGDADPIDLAGLPAHYYRFMSILKGRYLIEDAGVGLGYSYSGGSLPFDETAVHECDPNPKTADYAGHQRLIDQMTLFNNAYSGMIDALKVAFDSRDPAVATGAYLSSIGNMRGMLAKAQAIYRAADREGVRGGLTFERNQ